MIDPKDMEHCEEAIRNGSLSFHVASKALPKKIRDRALALYAFCRLADDEVDLKADKIPAVLALQERINAAYEGNPVNSPFDRAFTAMIQDCKMPKALPEALLEGLAWDAMERRYQTLSEVRDYSARVASAVGVMMCVIMEIKDPNTLARACDLGVAMQLTNIARDIGEDALEGRLYLPVEWLEEAGINQNSFLRKPKPTKAIRQMTRRLVVESDRLYLRSEAGIGKLPFKCRAGIFAARHIYAGIGDEIRNLGYETVTTRARTTRSRKIALVGLSILKTASITLMPQSAVVYAKPLKEVEFLIDSVTEGLPQNQRWSDKILSIMDHLRHMDKKRNIEVSQ